MPVTESNPPRPAPMLKWRLAMLSINGFAFLHALIVVGICVAPIGQWWHRLGAAIIALYLLPPLLAFLLRTFCPIQEGRCSATSRNFMRWWLLFNLQALYCRTSLLEELLRILPGVYSAWLRLWGAKIGRLTYWAPGVVILDRTFVDIGDDVVFGAGVRINPHVMTVNAQGEKELVIATVKIGDKALVGGYSLLTAGSEVADNEVLRACLVSPPFSRWEGGKRSKDVSSQA